MRHRLACVVAIAGLAINACTFAGCAGTGGGRGAGHGVRDKDYKVGYDSVSFLGVPEQNVSIEATGKEVPSTGYLLSWASIRNRGKYEYEWETRTVYYDDENRIVDETPWRRMLVGPFESARIETSSKSTVASRFMIEVRHRQDEPSLMKQDFGEGNF